MSQPPCVCYMNETKRECSKWNVERTHLLSVVHWRYEWNGATSVSMNNTHCSSVTEMNGYVYVKYGAIRTVKRLIRDQYYVVSCVFQIVLLLWLFSFCKKNLKNKTATTKIAYAALFLWIVLCIFRFCLLQFSVLTRKNEVKKVFDRYSVLCIK